MESSSPPPLSEAAKAVVPPLTQKNRKGKPYHRFRDVDEEIAECLEREPPSWNPLELKSETLVHLIRWLWRQGDAETIGRLATCLSKRMITIAKDWSRGFDKSTTEEIVQQSGFEIMELIFCSEVNRQSEYLEVVFRDAVKKRTLRVVAKTKTLRKRVTTESQLPVASDSRRDGGLLESQPDHGLTPQQKQDFEEQLNLQPDILRRCLSAVVDYRHRDAFVLFHREGWPIESKDGEVCIASRFGISGRQIRNWIKTAREQMRSAWEAQNE